jgi:hypothetical protein
MAIAHCDYGIVSLGRTRCRTNGENTPFWAGWYGGAAIAPEALIRPRLLLKAAARELAGKIEDAVCSAGLPALVSHQGKSSLVAGMMRNPNWKMN